MRTTALRPGELQWPCFIWSVILRLALSDVEQAYEQTDCLGLLELVRSFSCCLSVFQLLEANSSAAVWGFACELEMGPRDPGSG